MKIFAALYGLGRDYEPIKTSIEGVMDSIPHPTFEEISPRLISFDSRIQGYDHGPSPSPHFAFNVNKGNSYGNRGRGNFAGRSRGRGSFSTKGRGFHQQFSNISGGSDNKPICQICSRPGHNALKCWHRYDNNYQEDLPSALTAMHITEITDSSGSEWHPDTGATAHVTNTTQKLNQAQPYFGSDSVMVGDGNYLPITHVGSASLPSSSGKGYQPDSANGKK